ncbi:MAG: hypothetical protein K8R99_03875 [Actinomycetia bacterium]|nr:hypothetical protein [Actinomycetes bacterium]
MSEPTQSISVRLRRTVVQEGYVSVPVTEDLLQPADADGTRFLDGAKVLAAATLLEPVDGWLPEGSEVEVHPIQKAPDDPDVP